MQPICGFLVLLFLGAPPFDRPTSSQGVIDSAHAVELLFLVQALLIPGFCFVLLVSDRLRRMVYGTGVTRDMVSKPLWKFAWLWIGIVAVALALKLAVFYGPA
jgi:hypothetical protein